MCYNNLASFADGKFPANKKYRQLDADGGDEIDDLIDVKLPKLQRKAEEGAESLGYYNKADTFIS